MQQRYVPLWVFFCCCVWKAAGFSGALGYRPDSDSTRLCQAKEVSDTSRRKAISSCLPLLLPPTLTLAAPDLDETTTVPLEYIPSLSAYVAHFTLFGERFGAIVDTGSPFLTVPSTCNKWAYKYIWGCYHPERTRDSGYANTVEAFDNNYGTVVWRKAEFSWEPQETAQDVVFGVLGPDIMDGPGGVFLGLIKQTDSWIRPSFLGQTNYQSFCVDLRSNNNPKLVLSKQPMIAEGDDYVPLVRDLNRRYKAPVVHYTAKACRFEANGLPLYLSEKQPTYVIFDTGVTGMVVSQELYDGRYLQARKNREKSLWGQVTVGFKTKEGQEVHLSATKPVTTPLGNATPWPRFKGNLIVLGLAFLDGRAMTIDIDEGKLQFVD
ncbi:expressed unknown protein [Seminavis robusta]|uniref:Peptidase A1 domain-containing protein n=1 Tax=Seminavis robusta TaxID=568900 RepID=A0A9N8HC72_9STRA|nr:expressed unknown protein [Seminavis robusta]|eukprot:Sro307_g113330.1 n/a (378) ;mRNA; f:45414-46547